MQALARASSLDKNAAKYHHDLGNALADDGKVDRAITAYRRALRVDDALAEAHNDLGAAYYRKGWYAEAETCFRKAVERKPDHDVAHENLGAALRSQGRLGDGRRAYQRALTLRLRALLPRALQWKVAPPAAAAARLPSADADQATRLYLASNAHEERYQVDLALADIDKAISLQPDRVEYHVARARLLLGSGKPEEALAAADRGMTLEPGSADVHAVLSAIYRGASRHDLAMEAGRKAVELDPKSHAAHSSLSGAFWMKGKLEEAEKHAREAIRIAPKSILYSMNLAVILKDAGRCDEALRLYRDAAGKQLHHPGMLLNMGTVAMECGADLDAARSWYAKCRQIGEDPRALQSESIIDLLESRFEEAWPKYESRKRVSGHYERHAPFASIQAWNGEPLGEGRLLVYGEQGLGDEIMFASTFADLQQRAARITVLCDSRLEALFARSFPAMRIVPVPPLAKPQLDFVPDQAVAAGSLGMLFRRSEADFPPHRGYLVPDAGRTRASRGRLKALGSGKKIGVSWSGGMSSTGKARRSLSLEQLRPLLAVPGTTWISLQYGDWASEIAAFTAASGVPLHAFSGVTDDMDELASVIQALDLVISVCNTTVHVAGAIGKEVLVMAPFLPEWRYGLRSERMLWYPSARVFRQPAMGDWESVIAAVKAKL